MPAKPVLRYRDSGQIIQLWYYCGSDVDKAQGLAKIRNNPENSRANEGANRIFILADLTQSDGRVVTKLFTQPYLAMKTQSKNVLVNKATKWGNKVTNAILQETALTDESNHPDLDMIAWVARISYLASHSGEILFGVFAAMAFLALATGPHSVLLATTLLVCGAGGGTLAHQYTHQAELTHDGAFSFS